MLILNQADEGLYFELKEYERLGIPIFMEGHLVSPLQIVHAYMIREIGTYTYMRDYEMNKEGKVEKLCFHKVRQ